MSETQETKTNSTLLDLTRLMAEGLEFTLVLREVPVVMALNDGTKRKYVLRELTGMERDAYLKEMTKRIKRDATGRVLEGQMDTEGMFAQLLARSLVDTTTNGHPTVDELQRWPADTQRKLFQVAQRLSGLQAEEAQAEAKND